jgi:hypothetical protein
MLDSLAAGSTAEQRDRGKVDKLQQIMGILEVFYQPGKLFSSLENRRGAWVLPLLLTMLLSAATTYIAVHKIGMENIVRQQIESFRLSPEQMQQAMDRATSPSQMYITVGSVFLAIPLVSLVIAGVLTIFALIGSKQPKFSTNFSMVTLAYFPFSVITALMSILVVSIAPDVTTLDINNLLSTNVGAFMDKDTTPKFLYSFLSSMDLLVFGEIGLLAYGFSKVNKTTIGFGLIAVVVPWFIFVLGRAGVRMLF